MKAINNKTALKVVESKEIEGLYYVEADGEQVTVLSSKKNAEHMCDAFFIPGTDIRLLKTYKHNACADLNQRVAFFTQVPVKDQVIIIAYLENGEYSDIFQHELTDYMIDIEDMNRCAKTAIAGVMYCMTFHNNWINKPLPKQA